MKRRHAWTTAVVLLGIGLAAGVAYQRHDQNERAAPAMASASGAVPASAPSSKPSVPAAALAAPASAASAGSTTSAEDGLSPRARRMRDNWCGYGMKEALREAMALEARNEAARQAGRPVDEAGESDAEKVLTQAREERLRAWIRTLRSRSDPRAQALADLLADDLPSKAHLQDLARRSTDPMVTAMALMRPCKAPGCRPIDAAQWSRLEPDNLMAWIAQLQGVTVPPDQLSYLMERMGRDARRADDYVSAVGQMLATLADAGPGLQQMAETELMAGAQGALPVASLRQVVAACSPADLSPALRGRCERIAELLWDMPHVLGRSFAMSIARRVVPPGHPHRKDWEQRALHFDAVTEVLMAEQMVGLDKWAERLPAEGCQVATELHGMFRRTLQIPEWERTEQALAASSDSPQTLAERARGRRNGRSPLDEPPSRPAPASAPGR